MLYTNIENRILRKAIRGEIEAYEKYITELEEHYRVLEMDSARAICFTTKNELLEVEAHIDNLLLWLDSLSYKKGGNHDA